MTEYSAVPEVSALYAEQAQITQALDLLDNHNGTVSQYFIAALSAPPVQITTNDPGQSLISGVRSSLIQRYNAINKELRDLGVTGTPPNQAGGPPLAEAQPA